MCGIAVLCRHLSWSLDAPPWDGGVAQAGSLPTSEALETGVANRGPDCLRDVEVQVSGAQLKLVASTLCLRGLPTFQPRSDEHGNVLLYNGELFGCAELSAEDNDTEYVLQLLAQSTSTESMCRAVDSLTGPWALVFWQPAAGKLWFGRDPLGRRSLQIRICDGQGFAIASAAPPGFEFQDVPPFGMCSVDLAAIAPTFQTHWRELSTIGAGPVPGGPPPPLASQTALPDELRRIRPHAPAADSGREHRQDEGFDESLRRAVRRRLEALGPAPRDSMSLGAGALGLQPCRIAVLFSGGLDSLVVSRLVDLHAPQHEAVDLINVSFGEPPFSSPDRDSAIAGAVELADLSPGRSWRLVAVNVRPAEIEAQRARVASLTAPASSPMDMSIGTALWFASRGEGELLFPEELSGRKYKTASRVLFSGLGADEQLAGYKGRHRSVYNKGGDEALSVELDADVCRLWWRNLGRDDRLVGDHGRELRLPFLDEDLVAALCRLPVGALCDLSEPDGRGDKKLLRELALGLGLSERACFLAKRAMQFGSRSKKYVETDRSEGAVGSRKHKRAAVRSSAAAADSASAGGTEPG